MISIGYTRLVSNSLDQLWCQRKEQRLLGFRHASRFSQSWAADLYVNCSTAGWKLSGSRKELERGALRMVYGSSQVHYNLVLVKNSHRGKNIAHGRHRTDTR